MKLHTDAEGLVWAHCWIQARAGGPVAGRIDSGGGFRRLGSMESPTTADLLVLALRRAGGGPPLAVPCLRLPLRRAAGFVVTGLLPFVFAMAEGKRSEEVRIIRGAHSPCHILKVRSFLAIYSKRFICFAIYSKSFFFLQ